MASNASGEEITTGMLVHRIDRFGGRTRGEVLKFDVSGRRAQVNWLFAGTDWCGVDVLSPGPA